MSMLPVLEGTMVTLRPLTEADTSAIVSILQEPSVARWWGNYDEKRFHKEYFVDEQAAFVIEAGGKTAGIIQYDEENYPDYRHASLDLSLGTTFQDRGLGAEALRVLAKYLFAEKGHHRVTIDPASSNHRAIACYEKVGFKPVGVMRQYERAGDGTWRDGLLMDLLKGELK